MIALFGELDLSDDQKDQIHAVLEAEREVIGAVIRPLVEKHRVLRDTMLVDGVDESAIRAAAAGLGAAIGDAAVVAANLKEQIRPILTDDQRAALQEFHAERDRMIDAHLDRACGEQD